MTLMGNVPPLDPGLRGIPEANYAAAWQALETAGSHPLILSLAGATTTGVTPANISAIARAALDFHRKRGKPVRRPAPPSAAALPTQPPMARVRRCRPPPKSGPWVCSCPHLYKPAAVSSPRNRSLTREPFESYPTPPTSHRPSYEPQTASPPDPLSGSELSVPYGPGLEA
jgi:hypothetical protein